jgi:hypothetical protein
MWLLFHRKAGTRVIVDGESFTAHCPTCEKTTRFQEIEISENYGVWFVDVVGDKERAYRCGSCGDVFDLRDRAEPELQIDRTEALAIEERRLDEQRASRAVRIEDELAELKRKMGR